jgi:hypothetical protein
VFFKVIASVLFIIVLVIQQDGKVEEIKQIVEI